MRRVARHLAGHFGTTISLVRQPRLSGLDRVDSEPPILFLELRCLSPMKLNIAVVLLTLGLVAASSAGQARSTIDEIHMRATVQDVVLLADFSGKVIPVDFDPRFALTVRIDVVLLDGHICAVAEYAFNHGRDFRRGTTFDLRIDAYAFFSTCQ